uniref:Uncharacterized protein n=1 Tax=Megaselia scalaris TaxID=36166 RepID=T1GSC3_MEGSC
MAMTNLQLDSTSSLRQFGDANCQLKGLPFFRYPFGFVEKHILVWTFSSILCTCSAHCKRLFLKNKVMS